VASRRGSAIAIGHPHEATIEALAQFLPGMQARGLQLVAASAIVRQRMRETPAPSAPLVALELPAPASRNVQEVAAAVAPAIRQTARVAPESSAPVWNGGEVPWKRYPIE